jgi:hypothetical protein
MVQAGSPHHGESIFRLQMSNAHISGLIQVFIFDGRNSLVIGPITGASTSGLGSPVLLLVTFSVGVYTIWMYKRDVTTRKHYETLCNN